MLQEYVLRIRKIVLPGGQTMADRQSVHSAYPGSIPENSKMMMDAVALSQKLLLVSDEMSWGGGGVRQGTKRGARDIVNPCPSLPVVVGVDL
jgi:hypothetical protein